MEDVSVDPANVSRAATRIFKMRPIRSMSVTMPVDTNVAQTLIASAASSGDESTAKAGVNAELIWAWYCSSSIASVKSGSGTPPNNLRTWSIICRPKMRSPTTLAVEAENATRTTSEILCWSEAKAGISSLTADSLTTVSKRLLRRFIPNSRTCHLISS